MNANDPYLEHRRRLAARLTSDPGLQDDLMQEGAIAAWEAIESFNPALGVPLDAHVKQRIRWAMLRACQRLPLRLPEGIDLELVEGIGATPEDLVAAKEEAEQRDAAEQAEREAILGRVDQLDPRDQAIVLARLERRAYRAIAAEHGLSFSRVKALARRAFARLRSANEAAAEEELEAAVEHRIDVRATLVVVVRPASPLRRAS